MQELVTGMEKIRFDSEANVEELGAHPLTFPGVDSVQGHPRHGGAKPAVCKHWLRGLCKRGDGCDFLHDYDATRMPECYFYSKFGTSGAGQPMEPPPAPPSGLARSKRLMPPPDCGKKCHCHALGVTVPPRPAKRECSDKDCPLLHVAASTASPVGCPWYDRGFCRHGPLCKYKHTRREMCANYLVGFCPEGPKCKFVHLKAGLMTSSTDPSKEAACPWGLVQRDLAAAEERGGRATQGATSMWHPAPASSSVGHQWLSPEPTEPAGTRQLLQGKKNATGHDGHCTNPVGFARHQLTVGTGSTGITPCHENWDFPQLAAPPGTAGCGQAGAAAAFPRFERVQDWLVPGSSAQG